MNSIEATSAVYLSFSSVEVAIGALRARPYEVVLYCSSYNSCKAYQIEKELDCGVVIVPVELMKNMFVWAVTYNDSIYWSPVTS